MIKYNPATRRIVTCFIYAAYLFVFLEAAARIAFSNKSFFEYIKQGEYSADSKWRMEWIRRRRGVPDQSEFEFNHDLHDPTVGWVLKPNVKNLSVYNEKIMNINSKGVRGTAEHAYEKDPQKSRILILGDSFTFGTEVSDDETYAHYLQELAPHAEVINTAVHGYGYDQMLIRLKEEGLKYNPDIVLIPYLELDKKRSLLSFRDYGKSMFALKNGKLVLTHIPVLPPKEMYRREIFRSKLMDLLKIVVRNAEVKSGAYFEKEEKINEAIFAEMIKTIRSINAIPVFVYLEGLRDVPLKSGMDDEDKAFFDSWFEKKVYCIYLLPYLRSANAYRVRSLGIKNKVVIYKRQYGHYSPREHAIIATGIHDYLVKYKLIKP